MKPIFIGRGTFGEVFKDDEYVYKVCSLIKLSHQNEHMFIDNVFREAIFYSYLEETSNINATTICFRKPPASIPLAEVFVDENDDYKLVFRMKYLGTPLNLISYLTKSRLSRIFSHVLQACLWLHNNGWSHGDIKPSNILVGGDQTYLIDYGSIYFSSKFKCIQQRCTILYVSPEEFLDKTVGPPSDMWSFGAVLFEIFTGKIFITSLMRYNNVSDIAIKQFKDNTDKSFDPKDFLRQFYSSLTYSHITDFLYKSVKDRDILSILCSCLTIDPKFRSTAVDLLTKTTFFTQYKDEFKLQHVQIDDAKEIIEFKDVEDLGITCDERAIIVDQLHALNSSLKINEDMFEHSITLNDRFLFRHMTYFKNKNFKVLSVIASSFLTAAILFGYTFTFEEVKKFTRSMKMMESLTIDAYTLVKFFLLFIQKMDYRCFNVAPNDLLKLHPFYVIQSIEVAKKYPFLHGQIKFISNAIYPKKIE
jgi:serine/threonine protein kinase